MHRKDKPQGLLFGAVALAIVVGVFLSSPIAANQETDPPDGGAEGFYEGHGPGGVTDRSGGSGSGGSEDDGDSTDPDWFGFASWTQYGTWNGQQVALVPNRVVYGPVNSPFVVVADWLLRQVSSQYLRLW